MTISLRATRAFITNDVSLDGPVTVNQGTTNTYTITDYNRFSSYSATTTVGTISISGETVTLVVPTTTATQIKMSVSKDNTVSNFNVAVGATAIITPSITSPTEGTTSVNVAPTLSSTAFATAPVGADTHQSSQWQVSTNSAFTAIVFDSGTTTTNKTSISVPALALNTIHYARVRYTGTTLGTSAWSTTRTFTTTNQYVATPSISTTGSTAAVGGTPTFTGSPFSPVNGSDTHSASDWIVTKVSDGSVVYQSLGDTTNKTSIKIPNGLLVINTQYRIRLRYAGASFGYSGYGQLDFTTASKFSYEKYLAANLGQSVVVFGQDADTLTRLPALPALLTGGNTNVYVSTGEVVFSPNGNHLVASSANQGFLTIYKREGDNFTILPNTPLSQPNGVIGKCSYSADGNYLVCSSGNTAVVYQVVGDNYNRLSDLPSSGDNIAYSVGISADGTYIVVGKSTSGPTYNKVYPAVYFYKRTGSTLTLLSSRGASEPVRAVRFSTDGDWLAITARTNAFIYKRTGDTFDLSTSVDAVAGGITDFAWSPDSTQVLISGATNRLLKRNTDGSWLRLPNPAGSNGGTSNLGGAAWDNGQYVATADNNGASSTTQGIRIGKVVSDTYTEVPFPASIGLTGIAGLRFWAGYVG